MKQFGFILFSLLCSRVLFALPLLDRPYPLPAEFEEIITIYPDHENTVTKRAYWLVPNTARIVKDQNGKLAFGLVHSGVSSYDDAGITVLLNVTTQPYVDQKTLQKAKKLISDADAKEGAQSSFIFIVPNSMTARLLIGGQPHDWNFDTSKATAANGGSVDAGYPFQIKVEKQFDVRALVQAGGDDAATFGVLYTMKFPGIGDRVHATVTAHFNQAYEHFKSVVKASGWFGLAKASASSEWQNLKSNDWINVKVHQGRPGQVDSILSKMILDKLMDQLAQRTGFFARRLKPNGLGAVEAPGGGGLWGWGFSAGGGFESVNETSDLVVDIDMQFTRDQEIVFGMSFPSTSAELKPYVKNLTDSKKPFPTSEDFKNISNEHKSCRKENLKALKELLADGSITKEQHTEWVGKAMNNGCAVDYSFSRSEVKMLRNTDPAIKPLVIEAINTKNAKIDQ